MMKKLNLLLMFFLAAFSFAAAQTTTRTFDLENFDELSIGSAFKVNVTQGSSFRIVATGEKVDLDDLVARVSSKTLTVKYERSSRNRKRVSLDIQMPELRGIDLSGAASMNAEGFGGQREFELDVSGAAKLVLSIEVDELEFDLSGASSVVLNGRADRLEGDLSGASKLDAGNFSVKVADVDASGASSASVRASSRVDIDASGGSSIRYAGSAKDIRSNTSGGSSVRRMD